MSHGHSLRAAGTPRQNGAAYMILTASRCLLTPNTLSINSGETPKQDLDRCRHQFPSHEVPPAQFASHLDQPLGPKSRVGSGALFDVFLASTTESVRSK